MGESALKQKSVQSGLLTVLLLMQPMLDVLSYFMGQMGSTTVTTVLRTVLLFAVSFCGFAYSERKKVYALFWGVIGGFWLLHMASCLRGGYVQPMADAAEYLKLVQFPLWTLSFITLFQKLEDPARWAAGILTANFGLILFVILLSYLTGKPVYTYDYPERDMQIGILGWFGVANAQSAILTMLVPGVLLWAFRSRKLWLFSLCSLLGFGLLYVTGTRLTYYAALLTAGAFLVLILLERRQWLFCLPLLLSLILLLAFRGVSPMAERQARTADSYAIYEKKAQAIMGEDKDFVYKEGEEIPEETLQKIRKVYTDVYGQEGLYGTVLLGDLIDRFGVEAVMEQYHYSTQPQVLYNGRTKKLTALRMVWEEKDFLTKLFGFEYAEATLGDNIYDPENDFPALLYYNGYLGAGLYLLFAAFFPLSLLIAALREWRKLPELLTPELGAWALIFSFALGAALFSGQALRKPSVTVYFSLAAALIYITLHPPEPLRLYVKYARKDVVFRKKV